MIVRLEKDRTKPSMNFVGSDEFVCASNEGKDLIKDKEAGL